MKTEEKLKKNTETTGLDCIGNVQLEGQDQPVDLLLSFMQIVLLLTY